MRVYNIGEEPLSFAHNGSQFTWQPKGGGTFGLVQQRIEILVKDQDNPRGPKVPAPSYQNVWKDGVLAKPGLDWCDIDEDTWKWLQRGSNVAKHKNKLVKADSIATQLERELTTKELLNKKLQAEHEEWLAKIEKAKNEHIETVANRQKGPTQPKS